MITSAAFALSFAGSFDYGSEGSSRSLRKGPSRLADVAGSGEILVSSLSEQLVQGSGDFTFEHHRETTLKGMARPQSAATLAWTE